MRLQASILAGCAILLLGGAGCIPKLGQKAGKEPTKMIAGVPANVNDFLSTDELEMLKSHGFKVYTGNTPPTIDGKYNLNMTISYDPGTFAGAYPIGFRLPKYVYQFKDQTDDRLEALYWSTEVNDASTPNTGYISGSGDCFTVFIRQSADIEGCQYVSPQLISACKTPTGLKDVEMSYFAQSKTGDEYVCDMLAPVNYLRIAKTATASKSTATPPEKSSDEYEEVVEE